MEFPLPHDLLGRKWLLALEFQFSLGMATVLLPNLSFSLPSASSVASFSFRRSLPILADGK